MNIPSFDQLQQLVSNVKAAVATFKNHDASFLAKVQSALPIAGTALDALFPGLSLGGVGVSKVLSVVGGLATAEPTLTAAFNGVATAVHDNGVPPTQAQWDAFDHAADKAHEDFKAAVAGFRAAQQ